MGSYCDHHGRWFDVYPATADADERFVCRECEGTYPNAADANCHVCEVAE